MFVFGAPEKVSVSGAAASAVSDGSVATAPAVDASRRMSRRVMDAIPAHSTDVGQVPCINGLRGAPPPRATRLAQQIPPRQALEPTQFQTGFAPHPGL